MCANWINGYDPINLTNRLEESRLTDDKGKVSFNGFGFTEYVTVLNSMVELNKKIPMYEKKRIVTSSAFSAGKKGKITDIALLDEINKLEKEYLSQKPVKYVLISSVSIDRFCKLKSIRINGCSLTFHTYLPKTFQNAINSILRDASHLLYGEIPKNYLYVKINVSGKSYHEAADKAMDTIDIVRGIWNLFYNRGQSFRMSSKRKPVNKVVVGPLYTLHFPNGNLATDTWWYEPSYVEPSKILDPKKDLNNIYKFQKNVRDLINNCAFKPFIESALMRYSRALDLHDWESAFLKLWSLLETLTHTGENESHKVTVRRASSVFHERDYAKQVLNHLRDYRNKAVHVEAGNPDIEALLYQLKNFVEVILQFLLANKLKFRSLDEASKYFDLRDEPRVMKRKIQMIDYSLKLLKK